MNFFRTYLSHVFHTRYKNSPKRQTSSQVQEEETVTEDKQDTKKN